MGSPSRSSHRVEVEGFEPFDVETGTSLLDACEAAGVPMDCACGGVAACNSCRVCVLEGADHLSPLLDEEESFLDEPGQRLGCQAMVLGAVRVRLEPGI